MLSERQEDILDLVIREYLDTPDPVSSKTLTEDYGVGVSSATVRNEMAALEEMGLLLQPHTSAGRIPTEAGYRYFVRRLVSHEELPGSQQRNISHQFHQSRHDLERWMNLAATILAQVSQSASLVTAPQVKSNRYKHIVLVNTQGRMVLMVLVLMGGQVYQQMLALDEPVSQEMLDRTTDRLNALCEKLTAEEILAKAAKLSALERDIGEHASDVIGQADMRHKSVVHDGLVNLIDSSEFESEGARQSLRVLEERDVLEQVLAGSLPPDVDGVQVLIAGEGRWQELSHCSVILARYGVSGYSSGALGVIGPTRMNYGRAISIVSYISQLMSDMLVGVYGEG